MRWLLRKPRDDCEQHCEALRVAGNLDPLLARLLCRRGVETQQLQELLHPKVADLFPDPYLLADLEKASARLIEALRTGETIGIIADYDVDGACSAALLIQAWRAWGGACVYSIPDRLKEGYGPNASLFQRLHTQGAEGLVVTVDCGSNAQQVLQQKQQEGWEVIVLDHHALTGSREQAGQTQAVLAMVNPQRTDNRVDLGSLPACGVVMLLLAAMRRKIEADRNSQAPLSFPLQQWFDVLALAIVCDVVPFSPLNRAFVRAGLAHLNTQRHAGLAALANSAGIEPPFSIRDLGFALGPRLNAGGRMGESELAVELLLCVEHEADKRAHRIAQALENHNRRRREQQQVCSKQAQDKVQKQLQAQASTQEAQQGGQQGVKKACFAYDNAWSIGVLGPSASRVAERFLCPIFLAAPSPVARELNAGSNLLRGSARLPPRGWDNYSLAHIVSRARARGLLLSAGGHARACGFSLLEEKGAAFQEFLDEVSQEEAQKVAGNSGVNSGIRESCVESSGVVDMELLPSAVEEALASHLERLAPFGVGHSEPLFAFREVFVEDCRFVGYARQHVACTFSAQGGIARARAIAFNAVARGLAQPLKNAAETRSPHWAVGCVRRDPYTRGAQIVLEDFACLIEEAV